MGKRTWTDEQIYVLRQEFENGTPIAEISELLGKTIFSVKNYATRHDIPHASYSSWTKEEDEILIKIWESPESIKNGLHLLPGRTYDACRVRADLRLKLGDKTPARAGSKSFILARIIRLLGNNGPMTVDEMALETGLSRKGIQSILKVGRGVYAHIIDWKRIDANHHAALFTVGPGEDKPRPAPKSANQSWREYKGRKRLKAGNFNPFLVAAGEVKPVETLRGRKFEQDMTIHLDHLDEMEAA